MYAAGIRSFYCDEDKVRRLLHLFVGTAPKTSCFLSRGESIIQILADSAGANSGLEQNGLPAPVSPGAVLEYLRHPARPGVGSFADDAFDNREVLAPELRRLGAAHGKTQAYLATPMGL